MTRSIESVALQLMKELQKECEQKPDALHYRPVAEIAGPICKSQDEFDLVMRFIGPEQNRLINSWRRDDGKLVAQPNAVGNAWVENHKEKWPPAARIALIGLIWALALAGSGLILEWLQR